MSGTLALLFGLLGACLGVPETPLNEEAWAFLVAGSKGISNYRHQADVCHSYHVMIAEGIPADRIIVMMYNDVVNLKDNPWPGKLYNKPNGTDVYAGVRIDYKDKDVTPLNFLNVLKGNKTAMEGIGTGRVIESDNSTNIFVYFSDHGFKGGLCFPADNCTSALFADDLHKAFDEMNKAKSYNKIIIYIEACYSGSLFENMLNEDLRVFAITAANRDESSYPEYCLTGKNIPREFSLGDEFSVRWMEHMDQSATGTFDQFFDQFKRLRTAVRLSHVEMYGDFSIGRNAMTPNKVVHSVKNNSTIPTQPNATTILCDFTEPKQDEAQVELFEALLTAATTDFPQQKAIVDNGSLPFSLDMFPCYKNLIANYIRDCQIGKYGYLVEFYDQLANICILKMDTSKFLRDLPGLCAAYLPRLKP